MAESAERLQHVVARVGHEPRRVLHEDARDVFRREVGPVGRGHPEVPRHVLEAVGLEVARAHVVELGQDPGVHDVAPGHPVAPVADRALRHLHARGIAAQHGAVAPPRERHAVPARPRLQVLEIEAEDVVALEHVGIALAEDARALGQELGLGQLRARQHGREPGGVGDRDRDDPVGLARRVRELEAGRGGDLDVERHAPEVAEAHAEERGLAGCAAGTGAPGR